MNDVLRKMVESWSFSGEESLMVLALTGLVVGIILGSSGFFGLLVVLRRLERLKLARLEAEGPSNVLGELVLPVPDDVRWWGSTELMKFGDGQLITVGDGNRLYIDGRQLPHSPRADRYCREVVKAARRRRLESISKRIDESVEDT